MANARRVLLIEDDTTIRHVLVEALRDEGYEVREAGDGRAALAVLAMWLPTIIILDLMMPGMGGHEFRNEQRRRGLAGETPLIVLSASRNAREAARVLGAVATVSKPFDLAEVMLAVATADHTPSAQPIP